MVARTLEARLSARLLALAVAVLAGVGVVAALATDRALSAGDEERARATAAGASDSLAVELSEGDSHDEAAREVLAASAGEGVRVGLWFPDGQRASPSSPTLPLLERGRCATVEDVAGTPWLACAAAEGGIPVVAAVSIAAHRTAVATVWRTMGALVVLAAALLWWAIRRALRGPLAELTSLVRWTSLVRDREGEQDETSPVAPAAHTREIAHLTTAFDALVRDLMGALARERANSAHMAHELRTPLTALGAELDSLGGNEADPRVRRRLRADVARLADVIDAILVLSDRARGVRGEVVNVADVARDEAGGDVEVEAPDEALVEADERLVRLAMRNLLDNAGKYGGGPRLLRVTRAGERVSIAVMDEGPGLDVAARERMFDRYWRQAADGEGRGLGLALVRAVAERHGGGVSAAAGPRGRGLEVSLSLANVLGWHDGRGPGEPGEPGEEESRLGRG